MIGNKMKKILFLFLATSLIVVSHVSYAEEVYVGNKDYIIPQNAPSSARCKPDQPIIVQMGDIKIKMDRSASYRLQFENVEMAAEDLTKASTKVPCNLSFIKGIRQIGSAHYAVLYTKNDNQPTETEYEINENEIKNAETNNLFEQLDSGIKKYKNLYILPQTQAPTKNGEPVVFSCDMRTVKWCGTLYMHPSGLVLSYGLFESDYKTPFTMNELIEKDREKRKWLEDRIVK